LRSAHHEEDIMFAKKLVTIPLGIAMLGVTTFGVAACNPLEAVTQEGVEQIIEAATGGNLDVDAGAGASVPADFPAEVPLINATLESSVAIGSGTDRAWTLYYSVDDAKAAFDDATGKLRAAGFAEDSIVDAAEASVGFYSNGSLSVTVSAAPGSGSDTPKIVYLVAPQ